VKILLFPGFVSACEYPLGQDVITPRSLTLGNRGVNADGGRVRRFVTCSNLKPAVLASRQARCAGRERARSHEAIRCVVPGRLARWLQGRRQRREHILAPPGRSCQTRRDQFRRQSQALGISASTSWSVGTIHGTSNIASIPTDANKPGRHRQYRKCSRHGNRCTTKGRLYLVTSRIAGSESEGRMGRRHCHHGLRCRFRVPPVRKPEDRGQDSSLIIMARCHRASAAACQRALTLLRRLRHRPPKDGRPGVGKRSFGLFPPRKNGL
jgi:hypothetical protein